MKWDTLLLRLIARGFKQWQRNQERMQRELLRQARVNQKLAEKEARLTRRVSLDRELGSLSAEEFEAFVASLFEQEGWRATLTAHSSDMGIDINLSHVSDGRRAVVQCKKYKGSVGQPVIRDLYGVMTHLNVDEGYVITTGHFSPAALSFSQGKPIRLIDGENLLVWIRRHRSPMSNAEECASEENEGGLSLASPSLAGEDTKEMEENSDYHFDQETLRFLRQMQKGFNEQLDLIRSLKTEGTQQTSGGSPTSLSPNQVVHTCKHSVDRLQGLLREFAQTLSGEHSDQTPEADLASIFAMTSELLRRIGSGYRAALSLAGSNYSHQGLIQKVVDCHSAALDDIFDFFTEASLQVSLALSSPEEALRRGLATIRPDGKLGLKGCHLTYPRLTAALNGFTAKLRQGMLLQGGTGCLAELIAIACIVSGLFLLITRFF